MPRASVSSGLSSARRSHSSSIAAGSGLVKLWLMWGSLVGPAPRTDLPPPSSRRAFRMPAPDAVWRAPTSDSGKFFCVRRRFSRGAITIAVIVIVLAVAITAGVYVLLQRAKPFVAGENCQVTTPRGSLTLEIEQAEIAATIAAVAERRRLPQRAVVIAYATALQESKMLNLPFGDRDSVGIFQQRPSQGWGTPKQLLDPVYATRKFFAALVEVENYQKMPLHEAAQAVQRSADGTAYAQHEEDAKILAAAFTGRVPKAL